MFLGECIIINVSCREKELGEHEYVEPNYSYSMEWKDKLIDSSLFYSTSGHHNPR
jgi:hypothetical protein